MTECSKADMKARKEWRGLMIPAIGAAVILSSAFVNGVRIFQKHGWPNDAFKTTDYLLMTLPVFILITALYEEVNGG
jgi:hypothetical protein